jgi:hypothetical protein
VSANPPAGALGPLLDHVEETEVWRRMLADLATELMARGFSLELFLQQGDSYLLGFLNALVGDFAEFAGPELLAQADAYFQSLGLQAGFSAAEREAVLQEAVSRVAGDLTGLADETSAAFSRWFEKLRQAGMTDDTIVAALEADPSALAEVLGPWQRGIQDAARNMVVAVDETMRQAIDEAAPAGEGTKGSYWITMRDSNVCGRNDAGPERSCYRRHGMLLSMAEWMKMGLPGSGVTHCRGNCRCQLVPWSYLKEGAPAETLDASDAIGKAKDRAEKQHDRVVAYATERGDQYQAGEWMPGYGTAEQLQRARGRH